jgi:hypothetical protein
MKRNKIVYAFIDSQNLNLGIRELDTLKEIVTRNWFYKRWLSIVIMTKP